MESGILRVMTIGRWGLGLLAAMLVATSALAQSADCDRLRRVIADAGYNADPGQYSAAAGRQQDEIDRMAAYSRSIGCENRRFLFFGSDAPAQCAQINQQIARMRANLADLRARGGGGGARADLVARFNAQCSGAPGGGNLLDSLFGGQRNGDVSIEPLNPDNQPAAPLQPSQPSSGSQAVCVRTCDGSFFPVSYAANSSRYGGLEDMCRSLCPNAEVQLYTYPFGAAIDQAISATGQRYVDAPYALKYRQSLDTSCSCRRRGQSWADALAGAEARLGPENKGDIIVTAQKSAEMSRPAAAKPDPKAKPPKGAKPGATAGTDANGVDTALSAQTQAVSREASGILGSADSGSAVIPQSQGKSIDEVGPDGVMKHVRVIGPTL